MISAVDTNILLDVLIPDTDYEDRSKTLLDRALNHGSLIICEIVYAELASQFSTRETLDRFLTDTQIRIIPSSQEALHLASHKWQRHLKRKRTDPVRCPRCGAVVPGRSRILSDFLIAGHASVHADLLLTRDRGFYKKYYKELRLEDLTKG